MGAWHEIGAFGKTILSVKHLQEHMQSFRELFEEVKVDYVHFKDLCICMASVGVHNTPLLPPRWASLIDH